ncbi:hypothetical protein, partial [Burkholderia stagnalis]|uniref:hypothetical protein n=1 Tax=Burkholderia stagnalis TaxID=1503054 RepID=UPI001C8AABCE
VNRFFIAVPLWNGLYTVTVLNAGSRSAAVKKGVLAAAQMHYIFDTVVGNVREIPVDSWSTYVESVWSDCPDFFPSHEELPSLVQQGVVFFGPFAGFKD